jgi:predicted histone-like DNA-binding protein
MALQFTVIEKFNPITKAKKWYAQPIHTESKSLKEISNDIAEIAALSVDEVQNVIVNHINKLPEWEMDDDSVRIDGFGTFMLSFRSIGANSKEEVSTNLITDFYVLFSPDNKINIRVRTAIAN